MTIEHLLSEHQLPPFNAFDITDYEPALNQLIEEYMSAMNEAIQQESPNWEESVEPISQIGRRIDYVWSLLSHRKSVADGSDVRPVYEKLSETLSSFRSEVSQNSDFYRMYQKVFETRDQLNSAQIKVLENTLRGFRLSGVGLPAEQQAEFKALSQELSKLCNRFSENVLDSSEAWSLHLADSERLKGVPDSVIQRLSDRAKSRGHESGYLLGLDLTLYLPVMQYCHDRSLRQELYTAFITRASDSELHDSKYANEEVMSRILTCRKRQASLLGLESYAALSVEPKMAENPSQVLDFLNDIFEKARPLATRELSEMSDFAKAQYGIESIEIWDAPYLAEAMRRQLYDVDQEALRSYFPLPNVLDGLFTVVKRLFDVELSVIEDVDVPHPDTQCVCLKKEGKSLAYIYMDLYAREGKRGGAWVGPAQKLTRSEGAELRPVAFLVCNFSPPSESTPSLLTHNEMVTLFHEFGHALHHSLTKVSHPEISGISGVPWDAVELPSQFLENWCWSKEALGFLSSHIDSGESLPEEMVDKLIAAKNFHAGLATLRQIEFGLFDFRLHHEFVEGETDVQALMEDVQSKISVLPVPKFSRFANAFSHIFAGGYAAGYYSYKWAEVLAADAFSAFEEEGVFNRDTGSRFQREILERGGEADVNDMFKAFRGRLPSSEALLKQIGA